MRRKIIQIFLIVVVLSLLLAGGWYLVYDRVQKAYRAVLLLREEIAEAELKKKNIRALNTLLQDIDIERQKIENVFVNERSVVRFIEDIETMAELSQVDLTIESASLPISGEDGEPVFRFTTESRFESLFKFLALLEKINYQIKIEETQFRKNENRWTGRFEVRLLSYLF